MALPLFVAALALVPFPRQAIALTIVVDPSGQGDFTTLQAGVDAIWANLTPLQPDTLLVQPGFYDEDVAVPTPPGGLCVEYEGNEIHLICPGGPSETKVRSLSFPTVAADYCARWFWFFSGLSIDEQVNLTEHAGVVVFRTSIFRAGILQGSSGGCYDPNLFDCDVNGPSQLIGFGAGVACTLQSVRFRSAPLIVKPNCASLVLQNCSFEDVVGAAVVLTGNPANDVTFLSCRFANADTGIVVALQYWCYARLFLKNCDFEGVRGVGLQIRQGPGGRGCKPMQLRTSGNSFLGCGEAVHLDLGYAGHWISVSDTLQDCVGAGINADVTTATFTGLVSSVSGGPALDLRVQGVPIDNGGRGFMLNISHCDIRNAGVAGIRIQHQGDRSDFPRDTLTDNRIRGISGDGIFITQSAQSIPWTNWLLARNVVSSCAGNGIVLDAPSMPVLLERNTVAFTGGAGISVRTDAADTLRGNLLVENQVSGVRLLGDGTHLLGPNGFFGNGTSVTGQNGDSVGPAIHADPRFCAPALGDFALRSDSPMLAVEGYGQLGAIGVGCEPAPVPIQPAGRLFVSPQPSRFAAAFQFAPSALPMELKLHDLQGRQILVLSVPPLTTTVTWDGFRKSAGRAPAGVYLARLEQAGRLVADAKVVVVP